MHLPIVIITQLIIIKDFQSLIKKFLKLIKKRQTKNKKFIME